MNASHGIVLHYQICHVLRLGTGSLICLLLCAVLNIATPISALDQFQHQSDPVKQDHVAHRPDPFGYPWSVSQFSDRQNSILEHLRDNMQFDISEDILPRKLIDSLDESEDVYSRLTYIVRNIEVDIYYAALFSSKRDKHNRARQRHLRQKSGAHSGFRNNARGNSDDIDTTSEDEILNAFSSRCAYLQNGFWNYEWCHLLEVRQFHLRQPDNPSLSDPRHPQHVQGIRDPDWSLGKYHSTKMLRRGGVDTNSSAPINKMVSLFVNGQHCDENGRQRSTEVHVDCCPELAMNNMIQNKNNNNNKKGQSNDFAQAFIKSVTEPDTCTYKIEACSRLMCDGTELTQPAKSNSLVAIFKEIENRCIIKAEEWWTYEFCFKSGVRQMHLVVESTKQVDNAVVQTQTIEVQYSLGKAPVELYGNETALLSLSTNNRQPNQNAGVMKNGTRLDEVYNYVGMPSSILLGRKNKPDALVLHLGNGTICDIKNGVQRTSNVHLYCGARDLISEVVETRTCHYDVVVYINELCRHPGLTPRVSDYRSMKFYSAFDLALEESNEGVGAGFRNLQ